MKLQNFVVKECKSESEEEYAEKLINIFQELQSSNKSFILAIAQQLKPTEVIKTIKNAYLKKASTVCPKLWPIEAPIHLNKNKPNSKLNTQV